MGTCHCHIDSENDKILKLLKYKIKNYKAQNTITKDQIVCSKTASQAYNQPII